MVEYQYAFLGDASHVRIKVTTFQTSSTVYNASAQWEVSNDGSVWRPLSEQEKVVVESGTFTSMNGNIVFVPGVEMPVLYPRTHQQIIEMFIDAKKRHPTTQDLILFMKEHHIALREESESDIQRWTW